MPVLNTSDMKHYYMGKKSLKTPVYELATRRHKTVLHRQGSLKTPVYVLNTRRYEAVSHRIIKTKDSGVCIQYMAT